MVRRKDEIYIADRRRWILSSIFRDRNCQDSETDDSQGTQGREKSGRPSVSSTGDYRQNEGRLKKKKEVKNQFSLGTCFLNISSRSLQKLYRAKKL